MMELMDAVKAAYMRCSGMYVYCDGCEREYFAIEIGVSETLFTTISVCLCIHNRQTNFGNHPLQPWMTANLPYCLPRHETES